MSHPNGWLISFLFPVRDPPLTACQNRITVLTKTAIPLLLFYGIRYTRLCFMIQQLRQWRIGMFDDSKEKTWVWCLVGNITEVHEFGENKNLLTGTKQFRPGAKVYMAPANWGDGYEKIVVIGCPRHKRHYIEIIMRSAYIENYRIQKVYTPFLLKMMENSEFRWWDDSEDSYQSIRALADALNARKSKAE